MSSWTRKTRSAGPPPRDLRKADKDPAKVPPHKKERSYVLTYSETVLTVRTTVERFPSKAAREQFRKQLEHKRKERDQWGNWTRGNQSQKTTRRYDFVDHDEIIS